MNSRHFLYLFLFLTLFLSSASSTVIVNSDDWQEVALASNFAEVSDREMRLISNTGDARLTPQMIGKEDEVKILESKENAVVNDYETSLEAQGFENVESKTLDLHPGIYSEVRPQGYVVVDGSFSEETLIASPLANSREYGILYHNEDTMSYLSERPEKEVYFVGEFDGEPWTELENSFELFQRDDYVGTSLKVAEILVEDDRWPVIASRDQVQPATLTENNPNVFPEDQDRLLEFLERKNVRFVEVIGSENIGFGEELNEEEGLNVLVRRSRAFTGSDEVSGTEVSLQSVEANPREEFSATQGFDEQTGLFSLSSSHLLLLGLILGAFTLLYLLRTEYERSFIGEQ